MPKVGQRIAVAQVGSFKAEFSCEFSSFLLIMLRIADNQQWQAMKQLHTLSHICISMNY